MKQVILEKDKEETINNNTEKPSVVGNFNLVSKEEEEMANFLRENFLDSVNANDKPVKARKTLYTCFVKRLFDILVSLPICLLLLPIYAIFAFLTLCDVGRPILYKQSRVGKNGKLFVMAKFRNMNNKLDENGRLLPAAQRVTKFGKFMRKFSLDELTNFWNVLKGDMSIIGPRPVPVFFAERMSERHKMRHAVRPGLECPRVITLENKEALYQLKFENDVWYVENVSFATDVKLIFLLIKMTFSLKKRGAHAEKAIYFVGYGEDGYAIGLRRAKERYSIPKKADEEQDLITANNE